MDNPAADSLSQEYDQCIAKVNALTAHLKLLAQDHQLESL